MIFALLAILISCEQKKVQDNAISVIPQPSMISELEGTFKIDKDTKVFLACPSEEMQRIVGFLNERLQQAAGFKLEFTEEAGREECDVRRETAAGW